MGSRSLRVTKGRILCVLVLSLALPLILACEVGQRQEDVTLVNKTEIVVHVAEDGVEFTTLVPGERHAFIFLFSQPPSRLQAYDDDGRLVHDGMLVLDEVEADDFVYVIDVNVPTPTPAPPP